MKEFYNRVMTLKDVDGSAKSVVSYQDFSLGAVRSGSALIAQTYLPEILGI